PLLHAGEVIGVAHMGSRTAYEFSNEDKLLFRAMVSRATGLIIQAQLAARERTAREEAVQREAEQAETLALLDTLLATAPVGLALVDRELRYVRINHALAHIHGVPVEASLGRPLQEVVPELARLVAPLYQRVLDTGVPVLNQEVMGSPSGQGGRQVHWLVSYYPVKDRSGQAYMVGAVVLDITERKQQEARMQQTAEFRERFLGVVSHDLRNPLNTLLLSANMLLRDEDFPARHLKGVRRIVASGERMVRMISDLLDFTRGRLGGGIPVHPQRVNLRHLCRHVLEDLEATHCGRELRLKAEGHLHGEWDPDRLAQLLGNLAKNALDYSPAGTPVDVTLHEEGDALCMEVHNEGPPIPEVRLADIFEPFRRAMEEGAHPTSGLGLGLYIVRQIAEAHGGTVEVRSTVGDGTTFIVRLPRRGARPREAGAALN
ncbi:MAG TPA: PAS domain-containing sensor histidine kinase, partial [Archangium sp.]|uniref:PAS domain-containing sensor histidine kinase n=1 Tax=Archangium sp. TaxID=1872627 RepID=UPI002EDBB34B